MLMALVLSFICQVKVNYWSMFQGSCSAPSTFHSQEEYSRYGWITSLCCNNMYGCAVLKECEYLCNLSKISQER